MKRSETSAAKLVFFALAAVVLVLAAGSWMFYQFYYKQTIPPGAECITDNDCGIGGCSGQICANATSARTIITTCEWKEEYACYHQTTCGCIEGKCVWRQTPEFISCMQMYGR